MKKSLQEYCKENNMGYLLGQWDREKNVSIAPDSISFASNKKAWWRCEEGHEWETKVCTRTSGRNCPVCAGHVLLPGTNDFQTMHPELAELWNYEKKWRLDAKSGVFQQPEKCVVAVCKWPRVAGADQKPFKRGRLPNMQESCFTPGSK